MILTVLVDINEGLPANGDNLNGESAEDYRDICEASVASCTKSASASASASFLKPRIFYTLFAGRERYLSIHLRYTDMMLKQELVTEVHLWDFCRNEGDQQYLLDFMKSRVAHSDYIEKYILFQPEPTFPRDRRVFRHYYDHYHSSSYSPEDIIIEADDDIVFMDISSLGVFLAGVRDDDAMHFPLIINNDVSFIVLAIQGFHPLLNILYEKLYLKRGFYITRQFDFIVYPDFCYAMSIATFCNGHDLYHMHHSESPECSGLRYFVSKDNPDH